MPLSDTDRALAWALIFDGMLAVLLCLIHNLPELTLQKLLLLRVTDHSPFATRLPSNPAICSTSPTKIESIEHDNCYNTWLQALSKSPCKLKIRPILISFPTNSNDHTRNDFLGHSSSLMEYHFCVFSCKANHEWTLKKSKLPTVDSSILWDLRSTDSPQGRWFIYSINNWNISLLTFQAALCMFAYLVHSTERTRKKWHCPQDDSPMLTL